ncbi:MAG TPA: polysaccharide deacetylase family protein [Methylomirabilota bacterium]|jgi:peptidoglycan/xylan/chitin deacetylase (PgdA/CDA1 family)|nr:polysaccharide deacetylase family protein [Methylomirabilota bacterium]
MTAALGWLAGAAAAGWTGYAWGAQCALPAVAWRRGPAAGGQVALTFDDGPDPSATPRLLRLLAARGVRATFFLIGDRATRHPDIARAIAADGHEIGNHTWQHRNAWFLPPRATAREIEEGASRIADVTGCAPRLYRPPWGIVNVAALATARRLGLVTVLWSVQHEGLRPRAPDVQLRHLAGRIRPGAIVDLHDGPGLPGAPERLLAMLPGLLDLVVGRGLRPVGVSALLAAARPEEAPPPGRR